MRLLTTPGMLRDALKDSFEQATAIHAAVAWASTNFEGFDLIKKYRSKLRRFLVGMHFHQTHPEFIEEFLSENSVRFIMSPDGTFHPKVYFFELPENNWCCITGSPNFTRAAFETNAELAILFESTDPGGADCKKFLFEALDKWWPQGKHLTANELAEYREQWKRAQATLPHPPSVIDKPTTSGIDSDGGADIPDIPICRLKWNEFFYRVKKERYASDATMQVRLEVLLEIRKLFEEAPHFCDMGREQRYKVAGLVTYDNMDFKWFGSMTGNGTFFRNIKINNPIISSALDFIALEGPVKHDEYLYFVKEFKKAFPYPPGRDGVGIATRLLAMKRPDLFVCLNSRNRQRLYKEFEIRQRIGDHDYNKYWGCIVEPIRKSLWWKSSRPTDETQATVWDARAAMLDALFMK
jgi:HKD family nuclease